MTVIPVSASRRYDVLIGRGLMPDLGRRLAALLPGRTAALVTDGNVAPLYLAQAERSLQDAGFRTVSTVLPAGEANKNGQTYLALLEFLAEHQLTRADVLVALGGGVIGDLTGFAAATYLRGVAFVQVPTTLLAAVDASVGGKTAIDLSHGKNLAGAFYQPSLVLCDLDAFDTLPADILSDGCAEVIKYGMLGNPALLSLLETTDFRTAPEQTETVVAQCVAQKRDLVEQDERDTGQRQLLNLGHTLGHGIEKHSHYTISHGKAVAIGMTLITRAAIAFNLCPPPVLPRLIALLQRYGLPTEAPCKAAALYEASLSDKKRSGNTLSLVVPVAWGKSDLHPVSTADLMTWIERSLPS